MSETTNNTTNITTATVIANRVLSKKRLPHNFVMEFPNQPFTVHMLMNEGMRPSYETAYNRIRKALASKIIYKVGKSAPETSKRGAHRILYARLNAVTPAVTESEIVHATD